GSSRRPVRQVRDRLKPSGRRSMQRVDGVRICGKHRVEMVSMGAGIKSVGACLLAAAVAGASLIGEAEILGVAVDSKVALVDGEAAVVPGPAEDTVVFFDFREGEPRKLGEVAAPTSYLGAPATVAITADGTLALATASFSHDPADPGRIVYDD